MVEALHERGATAIHAGSRSGEGPDLPAVMPFSFDYDDPGTIAKAGERLADDPPELVLVATGVLTLEDGTGPERSFKQIDADAMARVLYLNTIGPALVAQAMLPLLPRKERSVFAAISAKVGSIEDNRIGGWHSYRASKAALNMLVKNFAIELARTHKQAVALALHPGTVDTALSEPFQSNLPDGQLTTAQNAAANLLDVLEAATPGDSGALVSYDGERLPF